MISAGGLLGVGTVEPESPGAGESGSPLGDFALFDRFLAEPGAALVSPGVAALHGNRAGKSAVLWIAGRPQSFHILGTFRTPEGRAGAFGNVVLVDPATFQERFDRLGRLDAIDLLGERADWNRLVFQFITKNWDDHELLKSAETLPLPTTSQLPGMERPELDVRHFAPAEYEGQTEAARAKMPRIQRDWMNRLPEREVTARPEEAPVAER